MQGNQGTLLVRPTSLTCEMFSNFPIILGARPSKRKIGDSADIKDGHRRKRVKAKSTVPPGVKIIDLDDDILAASAVSRGVTNSADSFATPLSDPASASTAPLPSYATQQESSTPANDSAHVSSSPTLPFATPATPVQAPVHSSASEKSSTPTGGPQLPSLPTPLPCMLTVSTNGVHC